MLPMRYGILNDFSDKLQSCIDLNIIKSISDRTLVMYKGKIVEDGKTLNVFNKPKNKYTKKLIESAF